MGSNVIDAGLLKRMFLAGVANLESKKEWINELNVFPVPDEERDRQTESFILR